MIWDLYDGPRSGISNFKMEPHYFNCTLAYEGGYTDQFELFPVTQEFLHIAEEQWKIYRDWEMKFHTGKVTLDTHPRNRGQNQHYDLLDDELKKQIGSLSKLPSMYSAEFRALSGQSHLPQGILRNLEARWTKIT